MDKILNQLIGAWEEPGVIGTRIEIDKKNILVLWMNTPVLETKYSIVKDGDEYILKLNKDELKYTQDATPYAIITRLSYKDERLTFSKNFKITGESTDILRKTANSRYGNYEIVDNQFTKELSGLWRSDEFSYELKFSKNKVSNNDSTIKYHVLQNKSYPQEYTLVDEDTSKRGLFEFINVKYTQNIIEATIPVCDAPSIVIRFKKV